MKALEQFRVEERLIHFWRSKKDQAATCKRNSSFEHTKPLSQEHLEETVLRYQTLKKGFLRPAGAQVRDGAQRNFEGGVLLEETHGHRFTRSQALRGAMRVGLPPRSTMGVQDA